MCAFCSNQWEENRGAVWHLPEISLKGKRRPLFCPSSILLPGTPLRWVRLHQPSWTKKMKVTIQRVGNKVERIQVSGDFGSCLQPQGASLPDLFFCESIKAWVFKLLSWGLSYCQPNRAPRWYSIIKWAIQGHRWGQGWRSSNEAKPGAQKPSFWSLLWYLCL